MEGSCIQHHTHYILHTELHTMLGTHYTESTLHSTLKTTFHTTLNTTLQITLNTTKEITLNTTLQIIPITLYTAMNTTLHTTVNACTPHYTEHSIVPNVWCTLQHGHIT